MGFLDKLKDAAGTAAKGTLQMVATSYGTVVGGEYTGCKVCSNSTFDTLVFILVGAEKGRHKIHDDIRTFEYLGGITRNDNISEVYQIRILFANGKTSDVELRTDKDKGRALSTEQWLAAMYAEIAQLLGGLMKNVQEPVSEQTRDWVNLIMCYTNNPQF